MKVEHFESNLPALIVESNRILPEVRNLGRILNSISGSTYEEKLAEPYLGRLSHIIEQLGVISPENVTLEARHFFSGAALFANGKICASLSPAGFAVKLPKNVRQSLLDERKGKEFRFFANGPIKREYVALSNWIIEDKRALQKLIEACVSHVVGELDSSSLAEK